MNKSIWINKSLYHKLLNLFNETQQTDKGLTFNKLINQVIREGLENS